MIDKSTRQAPAGLTALTEMLPTAGGMADLEIEIEADGPSVVDIVENPDGSAEVTIGDGTESDTDPFEGLAFDANLAEHMDASDLNVLANELHDLFEEDLRSREAWEKTIKDGLEVLGMKYEKRTQPWADACGVYSPLLAEAAVRFQAESITETFPAAGPVKTKIVGAIDRLKEDAAARVRAEMNHQLTDVMSEYRSEHERLLFSLGLEGSAFKKVFVNEALGRQTAMFVSAADLVVPYGASDLNTAERITHIIRMPRIDMDKAMDSGVYRTLELGDPVQLTGMDKLDEQKAKEQGFDLANDNRYQVLEMQVYKHLGQDDTKRPAKPYIISVERGTCQVLSIRRNWKEGDMLERKLQHFVHYVYIPGFGFYGLGLIHLIGGYAKGGTSLIRQLIDAGTLSNLPGGLKTRGMRIKGDTTPIAPGEWRDADVTSGVLKDNIVPLPYKEPSMVLSGLLDKITDEGRRLGAVADLKISDMSAQAPVGTTLAILEQQLKTMSAVQARVHASMKVEFKLLKDLIRDGEPQYTYTPERANAADKRRDFDMVDVIPVSDPNSATMAQRVVQMQAVFQMAEKAPQIYNLPELHRQMLEVMGVKNAEKLVPVEEDQKPRDPISENMGFLSGKPAKAFIHQNHAAHLQAHQAFLQDPMLQAQMGQSPMAQQMQGAVMSHIAEHLAFAYRQQIEQRLGAPLPLPDAEMDEQTEIQVSALVAQAAQQVLQMSQQQAAQQQAQQVAQDPVQQLREKEVNLKAGELERKVLKDKVDAELKEKQILVDAQRAGVMGRAQEPELQEQDRAQALQMQRELQQEFASNQIGESAAQAAEARDVRRMQRQQQDAVFKTKLKDLAESRAAARKRLDAEAAAKGNGNGRTSGAGPAAKAGDRKPDPSPGGGESGLD